MSHRFKKKTSGNTAMYRHFAAITLVCTGLLAMFADGEKAQAIAERAEQKQEEREARRERQAELAAQVQQPGGTWGTDEVHTQTVFSSASSVSNMSATFNGEFFGTQPPDALARLSASEREDLLEAMAENGADGSSLARARTASLEADSRRRSGSLGLQ